MQTRKLSRSVMWMVVCLCMAATLILPGLSYAASRAEINAAVDRALARFTVEVRGAQNLLESAKGVLVFAGVIKAGAGVGAEYGEGALRIDGTTRAYYSIASASIGLQFGVQRKDIIIVFLQQRALDAFRAKSGWQVGVDGSIVIVNLGANASIDTTTLNQPIVAFVVGQRGLMYNLTLEGTKITRISPQ
jgi:lipid-binding SYLF domain-containing protein